MKVNNASVTTEALAKRSTVEISTYPIIVPPDTLRGNNRVSKCPAGFLRGLSLSNSCNQYDSSPTTGLTSSCTPSNHSDRRDSVLSKRPPFPSLANFARGTQTPKLGEISPPTPSCYLPQCTWHTDSPVCNGSPDQTQTAQNRPKNAPKNQPLPSQWILSQECPKPAEVPVTPILHLCTGKPSRSSVMFPLLVTSKKS